MSDETPKDNLPITTPSNDLTLRSPEDLHPDDTIKQAKSKDLSILNDMLKAAYVGLGSVKTVSSLCKLISTVNQTVELRRKAANLQFGANTAGRNTEYDPDD